MNLATKITVVHILLIPFFIAFLLYGKLHLAIAVSVLAILSDGLDGYIARVWKQRTPLGEMLDPIADKLFILSALLSLIFVKGVSLTVTIPPYVPIVVLSRDAVIILGLVLIYVLKGEIEIKPSLSGKITTVLQMMTILLVLLQFRFAAYIWNTMVVFTIVSGIEYVVRGSRILGDKG